jgi:tetratricopeptide (TPR) repeat protein
MNSTRSIRSVLKVTTALGLVLVATACSNSPKFWEEPRPAPTVNLDDQDERAAMLLRYCDKLHKSGDLYVAASMCQRAFDTKPTDPAPLYPLAEIYKQIGATQQAANAYRAAIMINPDDFEAIYGLAKTSIDLGNYDVAEAQLERALQLNANDPRVYSAMGVVKDQKGEHGVAQALYRTGLLIDPDNVSLRNNLGRERRQPEPRPRRDLPGDAGGDGSAGLRRWTHRNPPRHARGRGELRQGIRRGRPACVRHVEASAQAGCEGRKRAGHGR